MNEREPKKDPREVSEDFAFRRGLKGVFGGMSGAFMNALLYELFLSGVQLGFLFNVLLSIGITLTLYGVVNMMLFLLSEPPGLKK